MIDDVPDNKWDRHIGVVRDGARALLAAAGGFLASALEGDALALELLDPVVGAALALVVLVVLVAEEAAELAVAERLGVRIVVVVRRREADHGGTLGREAVVELARGVAEVVAVP